MVQKTAVVSRGFREDVMALRSNHEEADTRMLLHASYLSHNKRDVIQSPDTDVLISCTAHFSSLGCKELWFKTGVRDQLRFIPVHHISQVLGPTFCEGLVAFHALTGCDSNSSLAGIGKKKAWEVIERSVVHQ